MIFNITMVERCTRCGVNENEVRLYDAIYEGRMSSICERCAIIENIPVIKKPAASQLKESEQGAGIFPRMKRLAGIKDEKKEDFYFREDKLKELEEKPELELPEQEKLNLIEHFHWEIMKNRRRKGLSPEKLAEALGESGVVIQMVEKGKLPENAENLIRKLEQFFQIRLRKISETEIFLKQQEKKPVLLDEEGNEIDIVPEEEIKIIEPEIEENIFNSEVSESLINIEDRKKNLSGIDMEKGEFDIKKANLSQIKISDLKELNKKRIEATRKEQIEEAKRIAERERLIEARKEKLRLLREKEANELDRILGGTELIGGNPEKEKLIFEEDFDGELI